MPARAVLAVAPVDVSANSRTGGAQTSPRKLIMMRHARNCALARRPACSPRTRQRIEVVVWVAAGTLTARSRGGTRATMTGRSRRKAQTAPER